MFDHFSCVLNAHVRQLRGNGTFYVVINETYFA
jgi:hypothetical protein